MIYLKDFKQGKLLYEALDSDIRLAILEELLAHGELNLAYFAKKLGVSNGAITAHIRKLHDAGLIEIATSSGVRGTQKICSLAADKLIVDFSSRPQAADRVETAHIDVGHYVDYDVHPTCGIATREKIVGAFDDPACFSYPERVNAGILWYARGYVEYLVPSYPVPAEELEELRFTLEIASEAPGYAAFYPSDVLFFLNGKPLGKFASKGEFNDRTGTVSPSWWYGNLGQYGKKVVVSVGREGAYVNGTPSSKVSLRDLAPDSRGQLRLRIAVSEEEGRCGGVTLFGRGFGDYDEGIAVSFVCAEKKND